MTDSINQGNGEADRLMTSVYDELRDLAARRLGRSGGKRHVDPTEIVHEVFLKVANHDSMDWNSRTHFFATSARAMRQLLVDQARRRGAQKRGGAADTLTLSEAVAPTSGREVDLLGLDDALHRLAALNERQVRIVELRFFGGMTIDEVAHVLGVSRRTVLADWSMARAWLRRELQTEAP